MSNVALATRQKSIIDTIDKMKGQIAAALPKHVSVDRMARITMTAIRTTPKLALCSEASLLGSLLTASQLGLEPNTPLGECYLIPYGDQCQFQLGYKGIMALAYRSGLYRRIFAEQVYPNDIFKIIGGLNPSLTHERMFPEEGEPDKYYAGYQTVDDGEHFVCWGRKRVENHAKKYSQAYNKASSPWQKSFDSMAKKTLIIDALRYAPKSVELANAIQADNATIQADFTGDEIVLTPTFEEPKEKQSLDSIVETLENKETP